VADEKHSWWLGQRVYITVTAAMGCFLGVSLATGAGAEALSKAYGEFAQEAQAHQSHYQPQTVNLAGWDGTKQAWRALFPEVVVMPCFLHMVLSIQKHCRRNKALYQALSNDLWHLYESQKPSEFGQRLRRLLEWTEADVSVPEKMVEKLKRLKANASEYKQTFEYQQAYRTSNQVDRLMNYQDRLLYGMQYFHGYERSAWQGLRAMAMLWNFHPYGRKIQAQIPHVQSPFERLNGFRYHDHWLRNLLIAASLNGRHTGKPVSHNSMEN
jgi:hypothetical protein